VSRCRRLNLGSDLDIVTWKPAVCGPGRVSCTYPRCPEHPRAAVGLDPRGCGGSQVLAPDQGFMDLLVQWLFPAAAPPYVTSVLAVPGND
jgi:hypothetical protein